MYKSCYHSTSSLKALNQFSPDFTWDLLSKGYWQFIQMVPQKTAKTKMTAIPIYVKRHLKASSPESSKLGGWIFVYSIRDLRFTKFVQVMILGWPLTFLRQGHICVPIQIWLKIIFSNVLKTKDWNLQCMIKVINLFSYKILSALALG